MTDLRGTVPVLVLSAPSGTGKTTIARTLVLGSDRYVFSVSATTRAPRPGERHGVHYDFVQEPDFERMRDEGELIEWAVVHGNYYGTPAANVRRAMESGSATVVLDIDVQGARQVRDEIPEAVLVFLLPPSAEELIRRLSGRGSEDLTEISKRLDTAVAEIDAMDEFDYLVVNRDLTEAIEQIEGIMEVESRRVPRIEGRGPFAAGLRDGIRAHARQLAAGSD